MRGGACICDTGDFLPAVLYCSVFPLSVESCEVNDEIFAACRRRSASLRHHYGAFTGACGKRPSRTPRR